jgi:hypothetical protein
MEEAYGFFLPEGITLLEISDGDSGISDEVDTTISTWYRGERYGFAQKATYITILDKYVKNFEVKNT